MLAERRDGLFVQIDRARQFFASDAEAKDAVRGVIATLSTREFAESQHLTWDIVDVYGVRLAEAGWYLKLTIDEDVPEVAVISFHPLQSPLKTNGGLVRP